MRYGASAGFVGTNKEGVLANNLFKLSHYYSNHHYLKVSKQMLSNLKETALNYGLSYSNWLQLMSNFSNEYFEIVISGKKALSKLIELNKTYIPNKLIAGSLTKSELPLLKDRYDSSETFIYICAEGTCKLPEKEVSKVVSEIKLKF